MFVLWTVLLFCLISRAFFAAQTKPWVVKGSPGAVVRAVSLSHQVVGSKQPLRRFAGGRLASVFPFPDPTHVGASGIGSALTAGVV